MLPQRSYRGRTTSYRTVRIQINRFQGFAPFKTGKAPTVRSARSRRLVDRGGAIARGTRRNATPNRFVAVSRMDVAHGDAATDMLSGSGNHVPPLPIIPRPRQQYTVIPESMEGEDKEPSEAKRPTDDCESLIGATVASETGDGCNSAAPQRGDPESGQPDDTDHRDPQSPQQPHLSKNQLRKLRRWEQKMQIKQRRKEQERAAKAARARALGRDIEAERREQASKYGKGRTRQLRLEEWNQRLQHGGSFEVCIDGSYEASMTAKEINSLALQIRYCYASNRRSGGKGSYSNQYPCRLTYTSAGGETMKHLRNVSGFDEWQAWGFNHSELSLEQYYKDKLSQVVYLTSDSENVLNELENGKIYVIGGIVDRNRLKRAALDRATSLGVVTAKLPIDEHLKTMPSTRVLTCNHVFDLILKCREHKGDWKKALMEVLPNRKHAEFDSHSGTHKK